jgi:GntR family transcriptional regulator
MHLVHVIESGRQLRTDPMTRHLNRGEIAADIRERIRNGEYPPGSKLPSYAELAEMYSVHRSTILRAMIELRATGDVRGEPGRGTFVPD